MAREEFVSRSLHLLSLERAAELDHSEKSSGSQSLSDPLAVSSQKVGLYGRHVFVFESARAKRKSQEKPLPANKLTNGDIVGVLSGNKPIAGQRISGVITRSTSSQISVVFDDLSDCVDLSDYNGMIQLVKLANDVTYRRIRSGLENLESYTSGRCLHLISVLFSEAQLLPSDQEYTSLQEQEIEIFPWHTRNLNSSQHKAVLSALSRRDVAIIHGPPGTGKTTTLVELILQAVKKGMKVLACAPSNIAVDNLVGKLAYAKAEVVRLGHPARLEHAVLQYSLDALVANSDSAGIIMDVRQDIDKAYSQCRKTKGSSDKRKLRSEIKTLKSELKEREEKCLKQILLRADIILCTLTGASPEGALRFLPHDHFDIVVIDECAQALEASCWIPLLRAPRCVLAGDHCQLPPTILSQEASDKGFLLSLMERVVKEMGGPVVSTLTTQYRMNSKIMAWSSHALYDDLLVPHESVGSHLLRDLPGVGDGRETTVALVYIDTAGCGVHELETDDVESKGNEGEADLVFHHIKKLRSSGVPDKDIAVIAPYSLQVELIRERIRTICSSTATDSLEVHTVDGFQGREKEAVIISLTRSNDRGEYGFLKEQRRSNVAVTRARRHLCLIGDSDTVSCEPFIKGMIETCHRVGEVWSAHEYMQDPDFEVFQCYQPKQNKNSEETKKHKKAVYNEDEITSHSGSGRSKPRPATQSIPTTLKAGSPTTITGDLQSKGDQRVTFEEAIHSFIDSDSAVLSFPSSLTGNERKIVHELCEQFGLLHVSKGYGKERFIEVQKYNIMAQAKSLPRDEAESLPTDSSEARELDPIAHEEVLGPKSEICDVCRKSILQENWELHQIQCLKRMEREKCTELKIRETNTTAHQPKHTSRKRSSQTSHGDPTHEDLDKLLAEVTLADSMCKFSQCSKKVNWLGIFCQFCKKRFCMEHRLPEVHGCGDSARQQSRKDLQREAKQGGKTSVFSGTKRSQIQAKLAKKLEEKSSARQTKTDTKSKGKR